MTVTVTCQGNSVWVAECVEVPGCYSHGQTREEALFNIMTALPVFMAEFDPYDEMDVLDVGAAWAEA